MKNYKITYTGRNSRFVDFEETATGNNPREAVESVYAQHMDENYFPDGFGTICNCKGDVIARPDDDRIRFDGGYFEAEEIYD